MPDFIKPESPRSPEAKYYVKADKFISAVKGEPFINGNGLYRLKGSEIMQQSSTYKKYFSLEDEENYIILQEAAIDGEEIIHFVNSRLTDYKVNLIFFRSVLHGLVFENAIVGGLQLNNSLIKGDVEINLNSTIGDITIRENSHVDDISIRENSQSGHVWIDKNSQCGNINIVSNSQILGIVLSSSSLIGFIWLREESQGGNISIRANSQSGFISITENSQIGFMSITENSRSEVIHVSLNSQSKDINIRDNSQIEGINITEDSQSGFIRINRNSQSGYINISENSQSGFISLMENSRSGSIRITGNSQSGYIYFENSTSSSLTISDNYLSLRLFNAAVPLMKLNNCFITSLMWQAGTRGELYISNSKINHLGLQYTSLLKDALISIRDCEIFIAQFNKLTVQGQLLLTNLRHLEKPFGFEPTLKSRLEANKSEDNVSELAKRIYNDRIEQLKNEESHYIKGKEELLKDVSEIPLWRIANSSLGKSEITSCDLTGYIFEYRDSRLLDTFISGTKLPKDKIEIYYSEPGTILDGIDYFEQKISIYSQLKKIFENQGNIVEATWYHSKAMENQQRLLQLDFRKQKKKWFSEEGFEFFNFKLNKLSNNHGESWRKALIFVLASSFIVYCLYYTSINYNKKFSFGGINHFIGRFFSFLNITRREDFMVGNDELNMLSYFFDYLGRVVTGFGIYQLIAAFRRHGRR